MATTTTTLMSRLEELLAAGSIWIEEGEYVGEAKDGTICGLGTVGYETSLERFLEESDQW